MRVLILLVTAIAAVASGHACAATYDDWYQLATAATSSPATVDPGDLVRKWTAPDGRSITAVVKQPNASAASVTLAPVPAGADARPYFEAMVNAAKAAKAGRLVIPPGRYTFASRGSTTAHWYIRGLTDVVIDGRGATLVFALNEDGIMVQDSQRLKITGLTLDYAFKTTSWGHMLPAPDGIHGVMQIDNPASVTAADGLGHIAQYDKATGKPDPADLRVYTTGAQWQAGGRYFSMGFGKNTIGKGFLVFHHYYGGNAIKLLGDPMSGAKQTQDIIIDGVRIVRAPGMGIVASGMKRGLAILNSQIVPADGEPTSTEYDAIHRFIPGGDLIIAGNTIAGAGDDNINLDPHPTPIAAIDATGTKLTLTDWSYFLRPGDVIAAFDYDFNFLGTAKIVGFPAVPSNGSNVVTTGAPIPGLTTKHFFRSLGFVGGRTLIQNNKFTLGGKVLVQTVNALVANNTFNGTGVRLLASAGQFQEGVGAMNVGVLGNSFTGGKLAARYNFPMASAISAYGVNGAGVYSDRPVNQWLSIIGNTIHDVPQAAISVGSSAHVVIRGNTIERANTMTPGGKDINVVGAAQVKLVP